METIDCLGLSCPQPVLGTKSFLETNPKTQTLSVLVDNLAAAQNVERFLGTRGFAAYIEGSGTDYVVTGKKEESAGCALSTSEAGKAPEKILLLIARDRIGRGDDRLGASLMQNFIKTLKEMGPDLWRLVFLNAGVKLTVEGAETVTVLKELEDEGVSILVCGTCLNFYDLLEKKQVGETTNMLDIVTSMQMAGKVISL
jgi:selenium metabolism protein YedF